jgi:hypothetical protein
LRGGSIELCDVDPGWPKATRDLTCPESWNLDEWKEMMHLQQLTRLDNQPHGKAKILALPEEAPITPDMTPEEQNRVQREWELQYYCWMFTPLLSEVVIEEEEKEAEPVEEEFKAPPGVNQQKWEAFMKKEYKAPVEGRLPTEEEIDRQIQELEEEI